MYNKGNMACTVTNNVFFCGKFYYVHISSITIKHGLGSGSEPVSDPDPARPGDPDPGRIHNTAVYSPQDVTSTPPLPPPPCTA
jgi:hypothetical protein